VTSSLTILRNADTSRDLHDAAVEYAEGTCVYVEFLSRFFQGGSHNLRFANHTKYGADGQTRRVRIYCLPFAPISAAVFFFNEIKGQVKSRTKTARTSHVFANNGFFLANATNFPQNSETQRETSTSIVAASSTDFFTIHAKAKSPRCGGNRVPAAKNSLTNATMREEAPDSRAPFRCVLRLSLSLSLSLSLGRSPRARTKRFLSNLRIAERFEVRGVKTVDDDDDDDDGSDALLRAIVAVGATAARRVPRRSRGINRGMRRSVEECKKRREKERREEREGAMERARMRKRERERERERRGVRARHSSGRSRRHVVYSRRVALI